MKSVFSPSEDRLEDMNERLAGNWWAVGLRGVLAIIFGLIAVFTPGIALLSLVMVFAFYCFLDGIAGIATAIRGARDGERWGLLLLSAILSLIAGVVALLMPGLSVFVFVLLIGAWAVITGIMETVAAFSVHTSHGRAWLAVAGIASIVFGLLLAVAPFAGALVLTWWVGAYALIYGVLLLVFALRLRPHGTGRPHIRPRPPHGHAAA